MDSPPESVVASRSKSEAPSTSTADTRHGRRRSITTKNCLPTYPPVNRIDAATTTNTTTNTTANTNTITHHQLRHQSPSPLPLHHHHRGHDDDAACPYEQSTTHFDHENIDYNGSSCTDQSSSPGEEEEVEEEEDITSVDRELGEIEAQLKRNKLNLDKEDNLQDEEEEEEEEEEVAVDTSDTSFAKAKNTLEHLFQFSAVKKCDEDSEIYNEIYAAATDFDKILSEEVDQISLEVNRRKSEVDLSQSSLLRRNTKDVDQISLELGHLDGGHSQICDDDISIENDRKNKIDGQG